MLASPSASFGCPAGNEQPIENYPVQTGSDFKAAWRGHLFHESRPDSRNKVIVSTGSVNPP
ncbi:hypothetical protein POX_d05463 [Penicillium oxalicum]|uniref:hypothetical protein n=1 Tax=Penicillium oxalicum TaxID=69781 RepID=UPI0020B7E0C1|nr:hypothetical protein POX_d05463 [Penicillium oxalicum]KAI2789962.1 hypothetical protein POX_d05463 [Penicillium oxalicum]